MKTKKNKHDKYLLSIICPVYNEQDKIKKMMDIILPQLNKYVELIVIDDGSKDNTLHILKEYQKKYNFKVVSKENSGVSDTRNYGLNIANGKYIGFIDGDDRVSDNYIEIVINELLNNKENFDLLIFNAAVYDHFKLISYSIDEKKEPESFIDEYGAYKYFQGLNCHKLGNVLWNKIYKKSIIDKHSILFQVNKKMGEDLIFNIYYCNNISKYKYINDVLYYYDLDMNVLTTSVYRKNTCEEIFKYNDYFKQININNKYSNVIGCFYLRRFPGIVLNESNAESFKDGLENIKKYKNNSYIKNSIKKISLKNYDLKLLISRIVYFNLILICIFFFLYKLRNRKKKI